MIDTGVQFINPHTNSDQRIESRGPIVALPTRPFLTRFLPHSGGEFRGGVCVPATHGINTVSLNKNLWDDSCSWSMEKLRVVTFSYFLHSIDHPGEKSFEQVWKPVAAYGSHVFQN